MKLDYKILEGNCKNTLKEIPDNSVQVCVTSPPYFNLRDYGTGHWEGGDPNCEHQGKVLSTNHNFDYADGKGSNGSVRSKVCEKCGAIRVDDQVGLEETPEEFIDKLVDIFSEVKRVLKEDGTLWVNLGDSYCNSNGFERASEEYKREGREGAKANDRSLTTLHNAGYKTKDLIGIPWMFAFAMRKAGWYLRQDIIWCLSGTTPLYIKTTDGFEKIQVKDLMKRSLSDISLWDGYRWVKINGFKQSNLFNKRIELTLSNGEKINCTDGHRWVLTSGEFKPASLLNVGDKLKKVCGFPDSAEKIDITDRQLTALAYWIFRGSRDKQNCKFSLQNINSEQRTVVDFIKEFSCTDIKNEIINNVPHITFNSKEFYEFAEKYITGRSVKTKTLTNEFWKLSNKQIETFLKTVISCVEHKKIDIDTEEFCIDSENSNFITDLRIIATRLNYTLNTYADGDITRCQITYKPSSYVEITNISDGKSTYFFDISIDSKPSIYSLSSGILTHNCKTNPMPESVEDRCTKSHEYLFLFSKSPNYYFDFEAIQEDAIEEVDGGIKFGGNKYGNNGEQFPNKQAGIYSGNEYFSNGKKRKRDVWQISVSSYRDAHFATFPKKLVEPCILAGSKPGDTVLDPFSGSGTTGVVAMENGRKYIGCELNKEYIKMTEERFNKELNGDKYFNDGVTKVRVSTEELWDD